MDLDLWGPPYQVPQETSNSLLPGSCNFHDDGCGDDRIQVDALNVISCKQVLRILIQKADVETDELQKELASLTNKLTWVKSEEWSNICCNALKQKIYCLNLFLRNLRSKGEGKASECFKLLKPAEGISELLKGLLRKYYEMNLPQTGQTLDICLKESNSDIPGQVTDVSLDTEKTSVPDTVSKVNDDQIISCISKECEARSLFLEFQEEKSVNSEKFELYRQAAIEDPFRHMECDSDGRNKLCVKSAACAGKTTIKLKLEWTKEADNFPLALISELQDYVSKSAFRLPKIKEGGVDEATGVGESESDLSSVVQQRKRKMVDGSAKVQSGVSKAKEESKIKERKVVSCKKRKRKEFDDGSSSVEMTMRDASSNPNGEITECSSMTEMPVNDKSVTPSAAEVDLSCLLLPELRAIAKKLKLKNVSKLKKPELVQQIATAMVNT